MGNAGAVMERVRRLIVEAGLEARLLEDGFQIPYDSSAVNVTIIDQNERVLIQCYAPVLREVPPTPELYKWVATEGQNYYFGSYHAAEMDDGTILLVFEHTLLGDYLDPEEFHSTVGALAGGANEMDEELQQRFGGKRFVDE